MPYITSVERFAEARGETRGEVRGKASVVLALLSEVCGSLPEDCEDRVWQLPSSALDGLAKALLRFQSLDDLQSWLDRYEATNE